MNPKAMDISKVKDFGQSVDFGKAASDYSTFRAGFPKAFFDLLLSEGLVAPGQRALDIGTGTGTVARGLASAGLNVVAKDLSLELLEEAWKLDQEAGVSVEYHQGSAEDLREPDESFDVFTAGQCWHWFDRPRAAQEAFRVLKPKGRIIVAHFDWLPLAGSVVEATEHLILKHNPDWALSGGTGEYPDWLSDLTDAGFEDLKTRSFDVDQPYSPDAWRGRIRASAGVKASLDAAGIQAFDDELKAVLCEKFPQDPLMVPHKVWFVAGKKPE